MLVGFLGEHFEMIDQRFGSVDKRFDGIDRRLDGIDRRLNGVDESIKALDAKIDDVREEVLGFTSDIHDRLSTRIESIATFVGMPKPLAADGFDSA